MNSGLEQEYSESNISKAVIEAYINANDINIEVKGEVSQPVAGIQQFGDPETEAYFLFFMQHKEEVLDWANNVYQKGNSR